MTRAVVASLLLGWTAGGCHDLTTAGAGTGCSDASPCRPFYQCVQGVCRPWTPRPPSSDPRPPDGGAMTDAPTDPMPAPETAANDTTDAPVDAPVDEAVDGPVEAAVDAPSCNLSAHLWQQMSTSPCLSSLWRFQRRPDGRWDAFEIGCGEVVSVASYDGTTVTLPFSYDVGAGRYRWPVDSACRGSEGTVQFTAGPEQGLWYSSTLTTVD
jgi:hypothetical protein